MKALKAFFYFLAVVAVATLAGCSTTSTKAADVSDSIRTSLDQAGLKAVSASQDRDKGVVTLSGHVTADGDKSRAESIARSCGGPHRLDKIPAVLRWWSGLTRRRPEGRHPFRA